MVAFGSHKPEGWFESTLRYKAGFDTPLMGGQFSGGENWGVEMRVLKVCTDKVWVLPCKACLLLINTT